MTDTDLLAAIQANPTALAQANAGNDAGCAATLSASLPPIVQPINQNRLITWATARGLLPAFAAGATNANPSIASACIAVESFLSGGAQTLDLTDPIIAGPTGLLFGLEASGILPANTDTTGKNPTPGSPEDLLAYSSVPQVIDHGQVSRVMLPARPGGIVGGSN